MVKKINKDNTKKLVLMAFLIMLTLGIINNIRGQIGPLIIDDFNLNYSSLGFMFSFLSIGSMITSFFIGNLTEKFGLIKLLFYGLVHNSISLVLIHLADSYYTLLFAFLLLGIGIPIISIVAINLISISFSEKRGKMINLMQVFYGLGGILAPYIIAGLGRFDLNWSFSYLSILILFIIIFFLFKVSKIPEMEIKRGKKISSTAQLLLDKFVILFSLIYFIQVGVEFSLITWLAPYLKDVYRSSELTISFYISAFFILFTLGRLAASFIVEKIGYFNFIMLTSGSTAVLIAAALLGGKEFNFLFSLTGIFVAVQIPTLQALILDSFDQDGVKVLGLTQTAGMLGATIIANWVVGLINDIYSIKTGFLFLIIILIFVILLTNYLKSTIKESKSFQNNFKKPEEFLEQNGS